VWVRQFGSDADELPTAIAVTGSGHLYIAGATRGNLAGANAGGEDAFVVRYDTRGRRVWTRQFGGVSDDRVTSLATGWFGDLYVGGWTDGTISGESAGGRDGFVARYDSRGKRRWVNQFGTAGNDSTNDLVLAPNLSLYVTGSTTGLLGGTGEGFPGTEDLFLARYSRQGALAWRHQYGSTGDDVATGIAADRYSRPYLTGTTTGSLGLANQGATDLFVTGLRSDGAVAWWRQQGSTEIERANDIGVSPRGDVYVAGTTFGSLAIANLGGGGDILISVFDATGTPRWTKQFGTVGMDEATSLTVAPSGDLLAGVYSDGGLGSVAEGVKDAFLARFDVRHNATWVVQAGTTGDDRLAALSMAHSNNVIGAGNTDGSLYGPNAGGTDVFVMRHDVRNRRSTGWQFGTSANDDARGVAEASGGDIVVVGRTDGALSGAASGNGDAFVARFTRSGTLRWVRQLGTAATDSATAVAVAPNGDVVVAGNTGGSLSPIAAEANVNDQDDVFIARFNRYGRLLWLHQFGTEEFDNVNALVLNASSDIYLGGTTIGSISTVAGEGNIEGLDGFVARYTARGTVVWRRQFGTESTDVVNAISRNPWGGIDIAGLTGGNLAEPNSGGNDAFVGHVSPSGQLEWVRQFGTEYNDLATAVASMPNGQVSVIGTTDGQLADSLSGFTDMFVARYNRNGSRRWLRQFGTVSNDVATAATAIRTGQLFFGGFTAGSLSGLNAGSDDLFLARID
jgi:hypothetical protein